MGIPHNLVMRTERRSMLSELQGGRHSPKDGLGENEVGEERGDVSPNYKRSKLMFGRT